MSQGWRILPEKFLNRVEAIISKEKKESVLTAFTIRKPCTFRANPLKISAVELKRKLSELSIEVTPVRWNSEAFILQNVPQKKLMETHLYKDGFLYIQGLSSMIPALVLDPKPNEKILDIAAAPGSKTTQIAAMMGNTGEILANDKSHIRNYKLKANIELQGVTNTHVTQFPGQIMWKKLPEYFDRSLVDVPCTMEGRFYTEDPKSFRDWSTNKIKYLIEIQKYLLRSAISCTKPGGTIVYSTCTLEPDENEKIIDWMIKKEEGAITIEEIVLPFFSFDRPLMEWNGRPMNNEVRHTARIIPTELYEGFYIAKIKKNHTTICKTV